MKSANNKSSKMIFTKMNWRISSFCGADGACVEAGPLNDASGKVAVRHSQRPNAEVIIYTKAEWKAFLKGVKAGEFEFEDAKNTTTFQG